MSKWGKYSEAELPTGGESSSSSHTDQRGRNKRIAIAGIVIIAIVAVLVFFAINRANKSSSDRQLIAVVNQDVGVEYSGGMINYSAEFVKTLDEKTFKLVSSSDAEEGLKDGTYDGAIYFPSSLSANILNINYKNPQAINIEYSISTEANEAEADAGYDHINEAYQEFNNKLSYAYVNAIMEEIELGQYNVEEIFNNDDSNLEAARTLAAGNYSVEFKAPELPKALPKFDDQNTNEYQDSGKAYADEVGRLYESAYTDAYKKANEKIDITINIQEVNDSAARMDETLVAIDEYIESTGDFGTKYTDYVTESVGTYQETVGEYITAVKAYKAAVHAHYVTGDGSYEAVKAAHGEMVRLQNLLGTVDLEAAAPEFPPNAQPPISERANISQARVDIQDAVTNYQNALKSQAQMLTPDEIMKNAMDVPPNANSKTYRQQLEEETNAFKQKAGDTSSQFNDIQGKNRSELEKAYSSHSEFLFDTVNVLNESNTKDHQELDSSIQSFLATAEANSGDTRTRLEDFKDMLSNAKVDGRISSEVMTFLIRPIQLVEK